MPPAPALQQKLIVTRTIAFGLSSGIIVFLAVVFFMGTSGEARPNPSIPLFTAISAVLWVVNIVAGRLIYARQLAPAALAPLISGLDDGAALAAIFPKVQAACLMRWSLLEGAALFSCVTLYLFHGSLKTQPQLSVCVALAIGAAGLILLSSPTEMALRELVRVARRSAPARVR